MPGYRISSLSGPPALGFSALTFPALRPLLAQASAAGPVVALCARDLVGAPAGLALAEILPGRTRGQGQARLHSLYVALPCRLRGLGRALLAGMESLLARAGAREVAVSWHETIPAAGAVARLLASRGFSPPARTQLLLRGDLSADMGEELRGLYARYADPARLPRGYSITPWAEMSAEDRDFIRSRKGQPDWHEPRADPFREEGGIEPLNSLVLRKEGLGIVGWLATHRIAPDTIRYTDLFIRKHPKVRPQAVIFLAIRAFWLQSGSKAPRMTMVQERDNTPLIALCQGRMGHIMDTSWFVEARKRLG